MMITTTTSDLIPLNNINPKNGPTAVLSAPLHFQPMLSGDYQNGISNQENFPNSVESPPQGVASSVRKSGGIGSDSLGAGGSGVCNGSAKVASNGFSVASVETALTNSNSINSMTSTKPFTHRPAIKSNFQLISQIFSTPSSPSDISDASFDRLLSENPDFLLDNVMTVSMQTQPRVFTSFDAFTLNDGVTFLHLPMSQSEFHGFHDFSRTVAALLEFVEDVLECSELVVVLEKEAKTGSNAIAPLARAFMYVGFSLVKPTTIRHDTSKYLMLGYKVDQ
ncbi:hypothetical protein BKA69DRAFT_1128316 [Paraphysoderma sedebokerense]|nr:hypothetical protein BKA69DRAFT_1128316 [Paraphysoderma sedebokerense]